MPNTDQATVPQTPPPQEQPAPQVEDDPASLQAMMDDLADAPPLYAPTNYWAYYQKRFVPELERLGLHDFRRRRGSVLSSFGATDLLETYNLDAGASPFLTRHAVARRAADKLVAGVHKAVPVRMPYGFDRRRLQRTVWDLADALGRAAGARPLSDLDASLAGNPEDHFEVDGRAYTMSVLHYYLRYAYVASHLDLDDASVVVELGPGAGKQVEVLKKLHPHLSFLLFDIPPQLYVCERYLSTVFPGEVVGYRETRTWDALPPEEERRGKVCMLAAWQFPLLEGVRHDLFWNATSFQEMEPHVVRNYLAHVAGGARHVYLSQEMAGKQQARTEGELGVMEPVTLQTYRDALPGYDLVDLTPARHVSGLSPTESDALWTVVGER